MSSSIFVRPYDAGDKQEIQYLHAVQGLGYRPPDWNRMLCSAVLEINGRIEMAAFLRKTAETYLLFDPWSLFRKRERLGQLMILHKELVAPAKREGLTDIHCWLPPQLEQFGKTLENEQFGWERAPWPLCYSKEVK